MAKDIRSPFWSCFVGTLGVYTNTMSILVFLRFKHMQTTAHALITNLEVVDLCFSLYFFTVIPAQIGSDSLHRILSIPAVCKGLAVVLYGAQGSMSVALACITVNRFCAIMFPNRKVSKSKSKKFLAIAVAITWVYPFGMATLASLGIGGNLQQLDQAAVVCLFRPKTTGHFVFQQVYFLSIGYPTLILMVLAYLIMFVTVHKSYQRVVVCFSREERLVRAQRTKNVRLAKVAAIVIALYIITFQPHFLIQAFDTQRKAKLWRFIALGLAASNTFFNFFIYAASHREYRQAYRRIFNECGCCRNNGNRIANID